MKSYELFIVVFHIHSMIFAVVDAPETQDTGIGINGKGIQVNGICRAFFNTDAAPHTFFFDDKMIIHGSLGPPNRIEICGEFSEGQRLLKYRCVSSFNLGYD
jgi:hypothetical protein